MALKPVLVAAVQASLIVLLTAVLEWLLDSVFPPLGPQAEIILAGSLTLSNIGVI